MAIKKKLKVQNISMIVFIILGLIFVFALFSIKTENDIRAKADVPEIVCNIGAHETKKCRLIDGTMSTRTRVCLKSKNKGGSSWSGWSKCGTD